MVRELEWVLPPQQERSRETLERFLAAAEELILEVGPEAVTVKQIAARAGSSVGSFYARFPDKESLLRCVFQRFYEQAVATVDAVLAPARWQEASARELIESAMAFVVRIFREKRALIVALTTRAARDPDLGAMGQRVGERIAARISEVLRQRNEVVAHPNPDQAIAFAVWLVLGALNSRALGATEARDLIPEDIIRHELSHMAISYVGLIEH